MSSEAPVIVREILDTFIEEAQELLRNWEQSCLHMTHLLAEGRFEVEGQKVLSELFRYAHTLKGSAKSAGLMPLGDLVHKLEDLITALLNGSIIAIQVADDLLLRAQSLMVFWLEIVQNMDDINVPAVQAELVNEIPSRLQLELQEVTEELTHLLGQPSAVVSRTLPAFGVFDEEAVPGVLQPALPQHKSDDLITANAGRKHRVDSLRVSGEKLESLVQMIGELSVVQSTIAEELKSIAGNHFHLRQASFASQKITREIYSRILALRSQPIGPLLQRIERIAYDTARPLRKNIRVELTGADLEFDKVVIEGLYEPLMHLVRNAVDHGVEGQEPRQQKGKDPMARIRVSVSQEANHTAIFVEDDGAGVDLDRVLKRAIEAGHADARTSYSEREIYQLMLLPGVSTKEQVTEISGRGVGLDVVHEAVVRLGGEMDIHSKRNEFTRFAIQLPLSFNIIEALIIRIDGQLYACPNREVCEIVNLQPMQKHLREGRILLRDEIVPVVHGHQLLSLSQSNSDARGLAQMALIIRSGKQPLALSIQEVASQGQLVVSSCAAALNPSGFFQGTSILPRGEPIFVLNMQAIAKHSRDILRDDDAPQRRPRLRQSIS